MRSAVATGMAAQGVPPAFLELGPGGVLAGLAKRTDKAWSVRSLSEFSDLAA
jgi:[acyl-carrier-protein] S-malonyltransferase